MIENFSKFSQSDAMVNVIIIKAVKKQVFSSYLPENSWTFFPLRDLSKCKMLVPPRRAGRQAEEESSLKKKKKKLLVQTTVNNGSFIILQTAVTVNLQAVCSFNYFVTYCGYVV
jgi:hypothetical protein